MPLALLGLRAGAQGPVWDGGNLCYRCVNTIRFPADSVENLDKW